MGMPWRGGGGGKDAQIMVKKFSSKCYTSHRMVPKAISVALDSVAARRAALEVNLSLAWLFS